MSVVTVRARDLKKEYVVYGGPRLLVHAVAERLTGKRRGRVLKALDGVSFDLPSGKTLGVIGVNGAGKSTLLRMIAGISTPTSGSLEVNGRVASLLEFGAGFEHRLSARENVFLNGTLLGIPRAELEKSLEEILDFAEVTEHADAPLYTFSSGMALRLGFAIAMRVAADILLLDEVLAVGDVAFQAKCLQTIERFKREGRTIVFVSHNLYDVGNVCDEVLLLNHGKVEAQGDPQEVIQRYWSTLVEEESRASLRLGALRVDFVAGKLYLWDGPRQITKGFCGYTSLRSFVRWHESDKAKWRVLERSDTRFVAEGTFWGLPIKQRWTLEREGERIRWDVDLEAIADVRLERQQANLMLSERYDAYEGPDGTRGEIGPFRRALDDDWEVLFATPSDAGPIALASSRPDLPVVELTSREHTSGQELTVVNSDLDFRGRLLQCRRTTPVEVAAGSVRPFFRGAFGVRRGGGGDT